MEEEIEEFRGYASRATWREIFKTVLSDRKGFIIMIVLVIFQSILDVIFPLVNQYALDHYFIPNADYSKLHLYIIIYAILALVYGLSVFGFLKAVGRIEVNTSYLLRKKSFENLQKLSFSYFDTNAQGWIMARVTSDSRKLSEIISWGLNDFLWGIIEMIAITIILLIKSPILSLILIVALPIVFFIVLKIRKKILKEYRHARRHNSEITGKLNEGILGSLTSKSLVIEDNNKLEFEGVVSKYYRSSLKAALFSAMLGPIVFIISYIVISFETYVGAIFILNGAMSIPVLYVFVEYAMRFFDPVFNISQLLGDFQQAQASAERIIGLINEVPDVKDSEEVILKYGTKFNPKRENYEPLLGSVEFKNVCFKYKTGEAVLNDFNLKIEKGMSVALVGHTGSGKSTIINLLSRFYEPTEGEILIDGINYKNRSLDWLHSNLGYVLQSPDLFSGSILDNVRYGQLNASDTDCINALKLVKADEFIELLPDKYLTNVGEGGNKLSIGERQLICFARAIVRNPKLLILDEATSSIDSKQEYMIQEGVNVLLKGRTSFVVAHRLSTIVNSDLIVVMDKGKIIEMGNHHELLSKKGYYFDLYKTQFKQEIDNKNL
jgi:ATP-binding cassette subfamily B protein